MHVGREQPLGLGEVAGGAEPDAVAVGVEDLGDGEAAGGVVLDDQEGQRGRVRGGLGGGGVRGRVRGRLRDADGDCCRGGGVQNGLTALRGRGVPLPRYGYGHRLRFLPSPRGCARPADPSGPGPANGMPFWDGASVICRYRGGKSASLMTKVTAGPRSVPPGETSRTPAWLPVCTGHGAAPQTPAGLNFQPVRRLRTGVWGGAPGVALHPRHAEQPRRGYASGRTTALIGIEPAPAIVTFRPGRGAWTIAPSPTYIPTWLASSK